MNKKGEGSRQINLQFYLIFALPVIIFMIFGFLYLSNLSHVEVLHTEESVEEHLFISRLYSSPTCFTYQEPGTLRVHPFIIDWERFTEGNLNSCLVTNKGVRITLDKVYEKKVIKNTAWLDKPTASKIKNVLIFDGMLFNGTMTVEVQYE